MAERGNEVKEERRERAETFKGTRKPGTASTLELMQQRGITGGNINMGADNDN